MAPCCCLCDGDAAVVVDPKKSAVVFHLNKTIPLNTVFVVVFVVVNCSYEPVGAVTPDELANAEANI